MGDLKGGYGKPKWEATQTLDEYARANAVDIKFEYMRVDRFIEELRKTLGNEKAACDPRKGQLALQLHEAWYSVDQLGESTDDVHQLVKMLLGRHARLESSRKIQVSDGFDGKPSREVTVWILKVPLRHQAYFSLSSLAFNRNFAVFLLAISAALVAAWFAHKQASL